MSKYIYIYFSICLLFSCENNSKDKSHLIGDFYSHTSLSSIIKNYEIGESSNHPKFQEFEGNLQSLFIKNVNIHSIKTVTHLDFYDRKLMQVTFEIQNSKTIHFDKMLKEQIWDEHIKFLVTDGSCFVNKGIIVNEPSTVKCYCWYDERLKNEYSKAKNTSKE